jgi:isochorismate synthase/2-succinyl-5-enolpyruvyl-6-hydroxy-3-cyclohexene-1-carboxylate synthase/2-succinyl-6-hydroxy-2,4-cyclohexadiene-1-carboxylate synthase/O-succinylbenzoate synthase
MHVVQVYVIICTNECSAHTFSTMYLRNYHLHRIQLSAPRTSGLSDGRFIHEGFVLKLHVDDNIVGFGEVCLYHFSILLFH